MIPFLDGVVAPLLDQVGTRWREGTLSPAHGHLAASLVRRVLEHLTVPPSASAPRLILCTLSGQSHELGAIMAGVAAATDGWAVTWLGAQLPATDIADAARRLRVQAVGVSLMHPSADRAVSDELRRLHSLLPRSNALLVGGAAAASYGETLGEIGAAPLLDMSALLSRLRQLSRGARKQRTSRRTASRRAITSRSA